MKEIDELIDLDERFTQFHLVERVDRTNIDKYPVLKELLRMRMEGARLDPVADKYLNKFIRS